MKKSEKIFVITLLTLFVGASYFVGSYSVQVVETETTTVSIDPENGDYVTSGPLAIDRGIFGRKYIESYRTQSASEAIQQAINNIPNQSGTVELKPGTYYLTESISGLNKTKIDTQD